MAKAFIAEFENMSGSGLAVIAPPLAEQAVAIGAEAKSSAFQATTRFIRVHVDAICSIAIGLTPTATVNTMRMAAGATEIFAVYPGHKISVITNT